MLFSSTNPVAAPAIPEQEFSRDITTGTSNTCLGRSAGEQITTGVNNTAVGYNSARSGQVFYITSQSNRVVIGNNDVTNIYGKVSFTSTSDKRDKVDFGTVPHGLDFVNKLEPVSFWFRKSRDTEEKTGQQRYGFIAQDILELEGSNNVIIDDEQEEHLKYKGEHLVPVLVNAIKELTAKNTALEARIAALEGS